MEVWRVESNFPYQCKRTNGRGLSAISISFYLLKAQSDRLQSVVAVNDERSNQTRWLRHVVKLWYIQQRNVKEFIFMTLFLTSCRWFVWSCHLQYVPWWSIWWFFTVIKSIWYGKLAYFIYFTVVPSFIVISTNHRHAKGAAEPVIVDWR